MPHKFNLRLHEPQHAAAAQERAQELGIELAAMRADQITRGLLASMRADRKAPLAVD